MPLGFYDVEDTAAPAVALPSRARLVFTDPPEAVERDIGEPGGPSPYAARRVEGAKPPAIMPGLAERALSRIEEPLYAAREFAPDPASAWQTRHPTAAKVAAEASQGIYNLGRAFSSPENIALAATAPLAPEGLGRVLALAFGGQALAGLPEQVKTAVARIRERGPTALPALIEPVGTALVAGGALTAAGRRAASEALPAALPDKPIAHRPGPGERVAGPAFRAGGKWSIGEPGQSHNDLRLAAGLPEVDEGQRQGVDYGFYTTAGRVVDRAEAARLEGKPGQLTSADLAATTTDVGPAAVTPPKPKPRPRARKGGETAPDLIGLMAADGIRINVSRKTAAVTPPKPKPRPRARKGGETAPDLIGLMAADGIRINVSRKTAAGSMLSDEVKQFYADYNKARGLFTTDASAMPLDAAAQYAYDRGWIKDATGDTLLAELRAAGGKVAQSTGRRAEEALSERDRQDEAFAMAQAGATPTKGVGATPKGRELVEVDALQPGDTFELEGQRFTVRRIDPDTLEVEVSDGKRFGRQQLMAGARYVADKATAPPAARVGVAAAPTAAVGVRPTQAASELREAERLAKQAGDAAAKQANPRARSFYQRQADYWQKKADSLRATATREDRRQETETGGANEVRERVDKPAGEVTSHDLLQLADKRRRLAIAAGVPVDEVLDRALSPGDITADELSATTRAAARPAGAPGRAPGAIELETTQPRLPGRAGGDRPSPAAGPQADPLSGVVGRTKRLTREDLGRVTTREAQDAVMQLRALETRRGVPYDQFYYDTDAHWGQSTPSGPWQYKRGPAIVAEMAGAADVYPVGDGTPTPRGGYGPAQPVGMVYESSEPPPETSWQASESRQPLPPGPGAETWTETDPRSHEAQLTAALAERRAGAKEPGAAAEAAKAAASTVNKGVASVRGMVDQVRLIGRVIWEKYSTEPKWTDYLDRKGKWKGARDIATRAAQQMRRQFYRAHDALAQEGMFNWLEAGGDKLRLQYWAENALTPALKQGYERALRLTPEEIADARNAAQYWESARQYAIDNGLWINFLQLYATHIQAAKAPIVRGVLGDFAYGKLSQRFKFATGRVFPTAFESEEAGFPLKTKRLGDVVPIWAELMNQTLADRAWIREGMKTKAADGRPVFAVAQGTGRALEPAPEWTVGEKGPAGVQGVPGVGRRHQRTGGATRGDVWRAEGGRSQCQTRDTGDALREGRKTR